MKTNLMFAALSVVEEIYIDKEFLVIYGFIIPYLVAVSIFGNKYLDELDDLKSHLTRYKLEKISRTQYSYFYHKKQKEICAFLKKMFFILVVIYSVHLLIIRLTYELNKSAFISSTVIFLSATLMLLIVYWLKGSATVNSNYRFPGPTRL